MKTYFKLVLSFQEGKNRLIPSFLSQTDISALDVSAIQRRFTQSFSILLNSLAGQNVKLLFLYAPKAFTSAWCVLNSASLVIQLVASCVKLAEWISLFPKKYVSIVSFCQLWKKINLLNTLLGRLSLTLHHTVKYSRDASDCAGPQPVLLWCFQTFFL